MMTFSKMQALGNDFAVFYGDEAQLMLISKKVKALSHRLTGIGFDQLLFINQKKESTFYFHIFNADGSSASQCLNGARCVARFLIEKGYSHTRHFFIENEAGLMEVSSPDFNTITLKIPNTAQIYPEKYHVNFTRIIMGNEHLIKVVNQLDSLDVPTMGKACQSYYPDGINVGFAEVISDEEILLRTYERGAGETSCCASNTLATVAVGIAQGWLKSTVIVKFSLGMLTIFLDLDKKYFYLTGPASHCYDGILYLSDFSDHP